MYEQNFSVSLGYDINKPCMARIIHQFKSKSSTVLINYPKCEHLSNNA